MTGRRPSRDTPSRDTGARGARRRPGKPASPPASQRATARSVALAVLERVRSTDAYANLVLPAEIERAALDGRDAAFATELTYGTLRARGTLDWLIGLYADRPVTRMEHHVLDALRLGAYQIVFAGTPPHAAVAETVACVPDTGARGFVNAVLRQLARSADTIPWPASEGDLTSYLQIHQSHPRWLARMWIDELGDQQAEGLCRANNTVPDVGVRVNTGRTSQAELLARFADAGLDAAPGRWAPNAITVRPHGRPDRWPGFAEGLFTVQDESSVLAAAAVDAAAGSTVVDMCAGPGGKTGQLAESGARVLALELHHERARLVVGTVDRLGAAGAHVVQADATAPPMAGGADAVLLDAPCSGLGVLRRRPEARWRVQPADIERSAALQRRLIDAGFGMLRAGGTLVYAVCTVSRAETVDLLEGFLHDHPEAEPLDVYPHVPRGPGQPRERWLQLLPHIHGVDGMFIDKVRRNA